MKRVPWTVPALLVAVGLSGPQLLDALRADPVEPTTPQVAGRAYIVTANRAYAKSLRRAAKSIRAGGKVADAQVRADKEYSQASRKAFAETFDKAFNAILPEGTEPQNDDQRGQYADMLDGIAEGVEQVK